MSCSSFSWMTVWFEKQAVCVKTLAVYVRISLYGIFINFIVNLLSKSIQLDEEHDLVNSYRTTRVT